MPVSLGREASEQGRCVGSELLAADRQLLGSEEDEGKLSKTR